MGEGKVLHQWHWSNENEFFEKFEERRLERSLGSFVGANDDMGMLLASSAQKDVETSDSRVLGVKVEFFFQVFGCFLQN